MGDTHDEYSKDPRIEELEEMLANAQTLCAKAVEAGTAWKNNAMEGAERAAKAERRIYELEKNKELFQQQRDVAIREKDRAVQLRDQVMKTAPMTMEIERLRLEPGEIVILRLQGDAQKGELEAIAAGLQHLKRTHPQNTFMAFAKGVELNIETLGETELRKVGLISSVRVDAGVAQLEAAFGTHTAALREAVSYMANHYKPSNPDDYVYTLIKGIRKILTVELKPEEKPTREDLIHLLSRVHLAISKREQPSYLDEIAIEINAALGSPETTEGR